MQIYHRLMFGVYGQFEFSSEYSLRKLYDSEFHISDQPQAQIRVIGPSSF